MADPVVEFLREAGPSRSARVAEALQRTGLSAEAARKRISRVSEPVQRFPIPLLPKRESFLYLQHQRTTEQMWTSFQRDLRETNSVFGAAIDAIAARGGVIPVDEFPIVAGAPIAMRGQVSADRVARQLTDAGVIQLATWEDWGEAYVLRRPELSGPSTDGHPHRRIAENIILDGVRDWARRIGLASYNSIAIRGDERQRVVGAFMFDLTGASYFLPLRKQEGKPGFLTVDVFSEGRLDEFQIRYFIRKAELHRASQPNTATFPMIIAPSFTGRAMTAGHAAGIVMATPSNLFGVRAGAAIVSLVETLNNAAAYVAGNPARITQLIDDLSEIEGAAGNLRGILFELITFYLIRMNAISADLGVKARDRKEFRSADIDVLGVETRGSCVLVECKGKNPGGIVTLDEVEKWLEKIPVFRAHLSQHDALREAAWRFEIWTSGEFSADALSKLQSEKQHRTRYPIDWKDGRAVEEVARRAKEKTILKALQEHFLHHPLAVTSPTV